jgi:hypothetical protein
MRRKSLIDCGVGLFWAAFVKIEPIIKRYKSMAYDLSVGFMRRFG